jgi:hypothetical protein
MLIVAPVVASQIVTSEQKGGFFRRFRRNFQAMIFKYRGENLKTKSGPNVAEGESNCSPEGAHSSGEVLGSAGTKDENLKKAEGCGGEVTNCAIGHLPCETSQGRPGPSPRHSGQFHEYFKLGFARFGDLSTLVSFRWRRQATSREVSGTVIGEFGQFLVSEVCVLSREASVFWNRFGSW